MSILRRLLGLVRPLPEPSCLDLGGAESRIGSQWSGFLQEWSEYAEQPNSDELLAEKAFNLVEVVIDLSRRDVESVLKSEYTRNGVLNERTLWPELLAVHLHLLDRIAFMVLDAEGRNRFVDCLVFGTAMQYVQNDGKEAADKFVRFYSLRTASYASLDAVPQKNEHGGFAIGNTIGCAMVEALGVKGGGTEFHPANVVIANRFLAYQTALAKGLAGKR